MTMTLCDNDVERPQEQAPLILDAMPLPAKFWSRRKVLVAATVGVVATLGALAILGNGAGGHVANVNQNAHIQHLKHYAQMRNKKIAPLFLRRFEEDKVIKLSVSKRCRIAFRKQSKMISDHGVELITEMFKHCFKDSESKECKQAMNKLEKFDEHVKNACQNKGHLCVLHEKHSKGEETENVCIPGACHDEEAKIAKYIERTANHEEEGLEECKDFKCEAHLDCGDELSADCDHAFHTEVNETIKKEAELVGKMFFACLKNHLSDGCQKAHKDIQEFDKTVKKSCQEKKGHACTLKVADNKDDEETETVCIPLECHGETAKVKKLVLDQFDRAESALEECKGAECKNTLQCGEEDEDEKEKEGEDEKEDGDEKEDEDEKDDEE